MHFISVVSSYLSTIHFKIVWPDKKSFKQKVKVALALGPYICFCIINQSDWARD